MNPPFSYKDAMLKRKAPPKPPPPPKLRPGWVILSRKNPRREEPDAGERKEASEPAPPPPEPDLNSDEEQELAFRKASANLQEEMEYKFIDQHCPPLREMYITWLEDVQRQGGEIGNHHWIYLRDTFPNFFCLINRVTRIIPSPDNESSEEEEDGF